MKPFLILGLIGLAGCTDGQWQKVAQLGGAQSVRCYSGGQLIYDGTSTGKVTNETNSDGYFFEDAKTRRIVEVSADCIFTAK